MPPTGFDPLASHAPLIVYVDHKSPYAYLAIEPTYALAAELGVEIDWRPLTLDIPSYLGSARLGARGEVVESQRSPEQWARVKHAYRDARRYASLRGVVLRGTTKIWDSALAGIGLSWAKQQGDEVLQAYLRRSFEPFWRRELDIEDVGVVEGVLREAGATTSGFRAHATGEGRARHDEEQRAIFDAGIFGVPTYVVDGETYFGREHLPRVRWHLNGRRGPAPDVAYEGAAFLETLASSAATDAFSVAVDFKSPQAWLAFEPTCALADALGVEVDWQPFVVAPWRRRPEPVPGEDRGSRHRRFRAEYAERELARYAGSRGLALRDLHDETDGTLAALGLLWVKRQKASAARAYVARAFAGYWSRSLDLASGAAIGALLEELGASSAGFEAFARAQGPEQLAALRAQLFDAGAYDVPAYRLGSEVFQGRQHLPLIRDLLSIS